MIYRQLDVNGDYSFGKGAQDFLRNSKAVAQAIKTNLRLLKGEWWEDISKGLPLFESILGQPGTNQNLMSIDLILKDQILSTKEVSSIKSFNSTYLGRRYSFLCTVETIYGEIILEETI